MSIYFNGKKYKPLGMDELSFGGKVYYKKSSPTPPTPAYEGLCFTAVDDGATIGYSITGSLPNINIEYSFDGEQWAYWNGTNIILSNTGDKVYVRNTEYTLSTSDSNYLQFTTPSGKISASGNVMSMVNFAPGLISYGMYRLFYQCTNLTTPPELPSTALASYCYRQMFYGCTSLMNIPMLPATTLAVGCYYSMFYGCRQIKLDSYRHGDYLITYRIPQTGTGTDASNALLYMFTDTGGSYTSTPSINTKYYTSNRLVPEPNYGLLCFTAVDAGAQVGYSITGSLPNIHIQSSTDGTNWSDWNGTVITLNNVGDKMYVRNTAYRLSISSSNYLQFTTPSGRISASGDIMSMSNLAYELYEYNMYKLFYHCTNLTTAPELSSTALANSCYYSMFEGCTSLTTAPELPATTLADNCCKNMFYGCTSLTTAPSILPAMSVPYNCYYSMFEGCTSLTTAPELPATTITSGYCYCSMFKDCTSLTTAPSILPAMTLLSSCYEIMFQGCTSLTTPPQLPATTTYQRCYNGMFMNCTSLTTLPELPATTQWGAYTSMFKGCTKIKLSTTQTGEYQTVYRMPLTGDGTPSNYGTSDMFANTGGTFKGTPYTYTTYYTSNTVI